MALKNMYVAAFVAMAMTCFVAGHEPQPSTYGRPPSYKPVHHDVPVKHGHDYTPPASYKPAPSYKPVPSYKPAPSYKPPPSYKPSPSNYSPHNGYGTRHKRSPQNEYLNPHQPSSYDKPPTYEPPKQEYKPPTSYEPQDSYKEKDSYDREDSYPKKPSYEPPKVEYKPPSYEPPKKEYKPPTSYEHKDVSYKEEDSYSHGSSYDKPNDSYDNKEEYRPEPPKYEPKEEYKPPRPTYQPKGETYEQPKQTYDHNDGLLHYVIDVNGKHEGSYELNDYPWKVDCNGHGYDYRYGYITGIWDDKDDFEDLDKVKCSGGKDSYGGLKLDLKHQKRIELSPKSAVYTPECYRGFVLTGLWDDHYGYRHVIYGKCTKVEYGDIDFDSCQNFYTKYKDGGPHDPYSKWNVQCPNDWAAVGLRRDYHRTDHLRCCKISHPHE